MIRTCPACHEPCLWPDTLCVCCRRWSTDPHHVCEAVVLCETYAEADLNSLECGCRTNPCKHEGAWTEASAAIRAYVERRREARGETT